jgi:Double zinc ribbon
MTMPAGWRPTNEQAAFGKEETLWRNQVTQGIFKKRVVEVQTITNYRVLRNDKGITFKDIDDVVVMNQHRVSQSNFTGTSYGRYARFGTGSTQSRSKTVGDVVFMRQGRPAVRFNQIADPHGVVRLAKSAKRNITQVLKTEEKRNKQVQRERDTVERPHKGGRVQRSVVICSQCKNENQKDSKFCNNCGANLQNPCSKCGKNNLENSAFCKQCGSKFGFQVLEETKTTLSSEPSIVEDNFLECMQPEFDIKIKYPATWHRIDKQDLKPPLVLAFRSSKETRSDQFLETMGISVLQVSADLSKNLTPQSCAESTIQSFKEENSDFVLLESTTTTLAGLPAQQVVFTAGGKKYLYVCTPRANKVYFIMYVSKPEKYLKFLSIIEQMVTSFEFIS